MIPCEVPVKRVYPGMRGDDDGGGREVDDAGKGRGVDDDGKGREAGHRGDLPRAQIPPAAEHLPVLVQQCKSKHPHLKSMQNSATSALGSI